MTKITVQVMPNTDGTVAHSQFVLETATHGVWNRTGYMDVKSDEPPQLINLTMYQRFIVEGHADYEVVYNADQATTTIVPKDHTPPEDPLVKPPPGTEPPLGESRSNPKSKPSGAESKK